MLASYHHILIHARRALSIELNNSRLLFSLGYMYGDLNRIWIFPPRQVLKNSYLSDKQSPLSSGVVTCLWRNNSRPLCISPSFHFEKETEGSQMSIIVGILLSVACIVVQCKDNV